MSLPLSFDDAKTRLASYQHTLDAAGVDGFEVSEEPWVAGSYPLKSILKAYLLSGISSSRRVVLSALL
ncbi:hypothetical protein WKW50_24245 [Ochrobactrum sp. GPK 3]|uniref:hypothetical protein n=1 Tax=Brucella sp. 22210 TaxID=3453892 RepID=UPI0031385F97